MEFQLRDFVQMKTLFWFLLGPLYLIQYSKIVLYIYSMCPFTLKYICFYFSKLQKSSNDNKMFQRDMDNRNISQRKINQINTQSELFTLITMVSSPSGYATQTRPFQYVTMFLLTVVWTWFIAFVTIYSSITPLIIVQ